MIHTGYKLRWGTGQLIHFEWGKKERLHDKFIKYHNYFNNININNLNIMMCRENKSNDFRTKFFFEKIKQITLIHNGILTVYLEQKWKRNRKKKNIPREKCTQYENVRVSVFPRLRRKTA